MSDRTDWRMEIDVTITNGDWSTRAQQSLQINANPDVMATIDVTAATKKLVANTTTELKAHIAEAEKEAAEPAD